MKAHTIGRIISYAQLLDLYMVRLSRRWTIRIYISRVRIPNNDAMLVTDLVRVVVGLIYGRLKGFLCSANLQTLLFQM